SPLPGDNKAANLRARLSNRVRKQMGNLRSCGSPSHCCEREFRTGDRVVSRTSPTFCATKVSSAVDLRLTTYEQTCIVHNRRYRRHGVHRFLPTTGNDGNLSHGTSSGPSLTDSAV